MHRNKSILIIIALILLQSCVERYFLEDHEQVNPKMVIEGNITTACGSQSIRISQSTSTEWPKYEPVSDCAVAVTNEQNRSIIFIEDVENPGTYTCTPDEGFLQIGQQYKLVVETPDRRVYESLYEPLFDCPPVDSVYYERQKIATNDPAQFRDGLQFYLDHEASDYFGKYYRMVVEETYEYHSSWPKKNYIETWRIIVAPYDYSTFVCYQTSTVDEIFTLTTSELATNAYQKFKLHYVSNSTQRLMYNYSVLIRQLSVSENAYTYWENIRKNNRESADFFTVQPSMVRGNIYNNSDSAEVVLGYFSVSAESTKRIVYERNEDFDFSGVSYCSPIIIEMIIPDSPRPLYLVEGVYDNGKEVRAWAPSECFDCTLLGGVLEKPEFFE
jgi:hypothetical protein